MKTKANKRPLIGVIVLAAAVFLCSDIVFAMAKRASSELSERRISQRPEELLEDGLGHKKALQYVPGEVIIKLKEREKPKHLFKQRYFKRKVKNKSILSRLKHRYELKNARPVFETWHSRLKAKNLSARELQAKTRAKFPQRKKPKEIKQVDLFPVYIVNTDEDVLAICAKLNEDPDIEYAEPNYIMELCMVPNDPYYSSSGSWTQSYDDLWSLKADKLNCEAAWDISQGQGAVVAVIDTGVDYEHEDLVDNIWINEGEIPNNGIDDDENGSIDDVRGYDFAYSDADPMDGHGHGTHCAGTIAAIGNNNIGVIGVAPMAKIMALKGLNDAGSGAITSLSSCVIYAADNRADVLSNSWGAAGTSQTMTDAFHYAHNAGCVCIAAAGNDNADVSSYVPASIDTVIAVAASTQNDEKCFFSNYGSLIDVAAPGGGYENELGDEQELNHFNILSTMPDNCTIANNYPSLKVSDGYCRLAGTSMACPHVAGVAALVIASNPQVGNEGARSVLQLFSDDIGDPGKDDYFGYGRVNAYLACGAADIFAVSITSPANLSYVRGYVDVYGSAYMEENFDRYELYYAPKDDPENVTLIISSTTPVQDDLLTLPGSPWDTTLCSDGAYVLILKVISAEGLDLTRFTYITIDNINEPPQFINLPCREGAVIDRLFEFQVKAYDPDDPQTPAGQIQFSSGTLPPNAQFDAATQIFSWSVSFSDRGIHEVLFNVSDNTHVITEKLILETLYLEVIQITGKNNTRGEGGPDIYGDIIAWYSYPEESYPPVGGNPDIYMYRISTGEEIPVCTSNYLQAMPNIYQDIIVWGDERNGDYDVYMFDISTGQESPVCIAPDMQRLPKIYRNNIVWKDSRSDGLMFPDIYMYDYVSGVETHISSDPHGLPSRPSIYDEKIIWTDNQLDLETAKRYYYLKMYDISDGSTTSLPVNNESSKGSPVIYKNKIVWSDTRNKYHDLYVYDFMEDGPETSLGVESVLNQYLDIHEDRIVWMSPQEWIPTPPFVINYDVYMYDLSKGLKFQITDNPDHQGFAAIYEDTIVWKDERDEKSDIYMANLYYYPQITSVNPIFLAPGLRFTITGINFGYNQRDSEVLFANGVEAVVRTWSNTEIECEVPEGAGSGLLRVCTLGGDSNGVEVETVASTVYFDPEPTDQETYENVELLFTIHAVDLNGNPIKYWLTFHDERIDINEDNVVDIGDLNLLISALYTQDGQPGCVARADLNSDGHINHFDLALFTGIRSTYPEGASFNETTGEFAWTPGFDQAGVYQATISAFNNNLSPCTYISKVITITVSDYVPVIAPSKPRQSRRKYQNRDNKLRKFYLRRK